MVQALSRPSKRLRERGNNLLKRAVEASYPSQRYALLRSVLGLYVEGEKKQREGERTKA